MSDEGEWLHYHNNLILGSMVEFPLYIQPATLDVLAFFSYLPSRWFTYRLLVKST
jgi:hypothetical protein